MSQPIELILTPRQLEAYRLAEQGMSQRSLALYLGISREAARDRVERARRKLAASTANSSTA